ncbi:insulinase family protein [Thiotrichales bacterium 19S11-10]|nr:insulinase family protein [Thiotrichales bacterium 19S11-10]
MTLKTTLTSVLTASILSMNTTYATTSSEIKLPKSTPIYEYSLSNGLKVIVKPDTRSPVVLSQIWYRVGSTYEPNGITGISHMLEHMMFKGTKDLKAGAIDELVESNGGQQNAFTSYDYTAYYQYWGKDKLELSFKIESDRMHQLELDQTLFDKEKQVVLEERNMRTEDNPIGYAFERHMAASNLSNPRHHPIIGWRSDIEQYTLNDLKEWYSNWYAPNNATIVVVGDVNPDEVHALAKQYFESIKKSDLSTQKKHEDQIAAGIKKVYVERPKVEVPTIIIGYKTPSIKTTTHSWEPYALMVLDSILGGNASSRLQTQLIRKEETASSISSEYDPFALNGTQFIIFALPTANTNLETLEKSILEQVESIVKNGINKDELDRVKANVLSSKIYSMDSLNAQAYLLGSFSSINLDAQLSQDYLNYLLEVTPEQIIEVAKTYLNKDNMTVTYLTQK